MQSPIDGLRNLPDGYKAVLDDEGKGIVLFARNGQIKVAGAVHLGEQGAIDFFMKFVKGVMHDHYEQTIFKHRDGKTITIEGTFTEEQLVNKMITTIMDLTNA